MGHGRQLGLLEHQRRQISYWAPPNTETPNNGANTYNVHILDPSSVVRLNMNPTIDSLVNYGAFYTQSQTLTIATAAGATNYGHVYDAQRIIGDLTNQAGGTLDVTSAALRLYLVNNGGLVNVAQGSIAASVINDGTVIVNPNHSGSQMYLLFTGDVSVGGTGSIVLNHGNSDWAQLNTSGGTLTQLAGHTISGRGLLNALLNNQGMVQADVAADTLYVRTNAKSNSGTFRAINGGILQIAGVNVAQTSAGHIVADGGAVSLQDGASVTGGTLNTANGGQVVNANDTATLTDVTNLGTYNITDAHTTVVNGTLVNDGTMTVNSNHGGAQTILQFNGDATLGGSGRVVLNHSSSNWASLNTGTGGTVTQLAGHTISGQGQLNANLVNQGLVSADVAGQPMYLQTNGKTNNSVMQATNGGYLRVAGVTITQSANGRIVGDGGTVEVRDGAVIVGGTLNTANGGQVTDDSGTATLQDVTNLGTYNIAPKDPE